MDTLDCIRKARTTRQYLSEDHPDKETFRKILEAGRYSPSANNKQPWQFIAVTDKNMLKTLGDLSPTGRHISNATFAVVVVTDPNNKWNEIDGARAVQNMTLAGWDLGYGNGWVGNIERDKVKEVLGIPKELHVLTILPFGKPVQSPPKVKKKDRKPFEEIAFVEKYGVSFS